MKKLLKSYKTSDTKYLLLVILFILAFMERVFFDLGSNIELVTIAMLLSAFYLGKKESLWLTFGIMAISDLFLGNSNIFIFTWSGFLIPSFIIGSQFVKMTATGIKRAIVGILSGISTTSFFYLWTNFGVWLLDSWGMYPNTISGLLQSYINGLPFLRYQASSTLFFTLIGFSLTEISIYLYSHIKTKCQIRHFVWQA